MSVSIDADASQKSSSQHKQILGSPFPIRLVADTPDLSHTEPSGEGLQMVQAGQPAKVQLQLLDKFGNTAVAGDWLECEAAAGSAPHAVKALPEQPLPQSTRSFRRLDE